LANASPLSQQKGKNRQPDERRQNGGGIVRRVTPWILLVLVTLAGFAPAVARAGTTFVQNTSPANAMKDYLKHQKSERKKIRKSQKKAENHFKKVHQQGR
jgi:uncharacterized membrane protein